MKSDNRKLREYISSYIKKFIAEAEEEAPADDAAAADAGGDEENPFEAGEAAGEGGDEGGDAKGGGKEGEAGKGGQKSTGIPIQFDISKVKRYNKSNFLSNSGVVKSIDKKGMVVTTQPDNVDVLVNFDDITENVKKFFKTKK